ncbi:MAG: flagellar M-ring protein FliF [Synergistetes bacterium]|nr:flagellar M-ring protein FliF [Synergistota bacterium]
MFERIRSVFSSLLGKWESLSKPQRIVVLGAGAALLISFVLLLLWAREPQYVPLFTNLDPKDASAVIEQLDKMKVPYEIADEGKTVLVPMDKVYNLRIQLAGMGLPTQGVVGFEIFEKPKFGLTTFQEQINYLRALEGELTRTIMNLEPVELAKVNIVLPQPRLYVEEQKATTASVLVKLRPGAKLSVEQVKAIVHLVAHSVEGLSPDDVVVVDTQGNILTEMLHEEYILRGVEKVSTLQKEIESLYEKDLETKLKTMLEKVFGPGRAVAKVKVEIDLNKREVKRETFKPVVGSSGIVRSEQNIEEQYKGTVAPPSGVPGTQTNIPGYQVPEKKGEEVEYAKSETIRNYEVSKEEEKEVFAPGKIKRMTVSVVVDAKLDPEQLQNLKNTVAAAVGYDPNRGDEIVVQTMEFNVAYLRELEEELKAQERLRLVLTLGILGALAGALVGYLLWRRWRRKKLEEEAKRAAEAVSEEKRPRLEEMLAHPELFLEEERVIEIEDLRAFASRYPEEVAKVIKSWLYEE